MSGLYHLPKTEGRLGLAEALTLALDYEQMRIEERERRARNASLFADRLEDRKYTKSEVKELILNFCWG